MNDVKALKITLNSFEFAKEFVYFITVSIDSTNTKVNLVSIKLIILLLQIILFLLSIPLYSH